MILNKFKVETLIMSDYLIKMTESDYLFDGPAEINLKIIDKYGSISQDLVYYLDYFNSCQLKNIRYFLNRIEHFQMGKIRSGIQQLKYFLKQIIRQFFFRRVKIICIFRDNYISDLIKEQDQKFIQIKRLKIIRKFYIPAKKRILNATIQANNTVILTYQHMLYFFSNKNAIKEKPIEIIEQITPLNQVFIVSQDQKWLFYGDYLALTKPFKPKFQKDCQFVQFSECSSYLAIYTSRNEFSLINLRLKKKQIPSWVQFDFMYYQFQSLKIIKENYSNGERAIFKLIINQEAKNQMEEKN